MECPNYRLRLFLSVDLVGSTAYKNGKGKDTDKGSLYPKWVVETRKFYRTFPGFVRSKYLESFFNKKQSDFVRRGAVIPLATPPLLWKTVGDEILFCCRVHSVEHLGCCVQAFLASLGDYGKQLEESGIELDVKGSGWLAAFPGRNKAVRIFRTDDAADEGDDDYFDEKMEAHVDATPEHFDFLGAEIDAGFRVAQNASSENFVGSLELIWLLTKAAHLNLFTGNFSYHGRKSLKGVISNRTYPIMSVDTERSHSRREVRMRERLLSKEPEVSPIILHDFLSSFMHDEELELPLLPLPDGLSTAPMKPQSYTSFVSGWDKFAAREVSNDARLNDSALQASSGMQQSEGEIAAQPRTVDLAKNLASLGSKMRAAQVLSASTAKPMKGQMFLGEPAFVISRKPDVSHQDLVHELSKALSKYTSGWQISDFSTNETRLFFDTSVHSAETMSAIRDGLLRIDFVTEVSNVPIGTSS